MEPASTAQAPTLADRIRCGDAAAEEELIQRFSGPVFALAFARTRDREAARDLQQETLRAVLQALRDGALRDAGKLAAFVSGTARNLTNNYIRTRNRSSREDPLPADVASLDAGDPAEDSQRLEQVRSALRVLGPIDREILLLTLVKGMKPGEIAVQVRLTSEVVRQRKSRAIRRVIEALKGVSRT